MKKIFTTLFAAAALVFGVQAQENLKIHFADGTTTTHKVAAIDSITFEEEPVQESLFSSIEVTDITSSTAVISVTVTDPTASYALIVCTAAYLGQYSVEYIAEALLSQTTADDICQGNVSYRWNQLPSESSFLVLAIAFDPLQGAAITEIAHTTFTTLAAAPAEKSDNVITMSVEEGVFNLTTTNDDPYLLVVYPTSELGGGEYTPQDLFDYELLYYSYYPEDFYYYSGGFSQSISTIFRAAGEYIFIAAGVDINNLTQNTDLVTLTITVTEEDLAGGAARVQAKVADAVKKQQFKSLQAVKTVSVLKK